MRVRCVKEFHSKIYPENNHGILGCEYHVWQARWSNIWNDPDPMHYLLHELPSGLWVNCERFELVKEVP